MTAERPVQVPPIKSQGIKTKLVPWIRELVPPDFDGRWIEPFMGTGVVGFNLAAGDALMCDTNPHLVEFYARVSDATITADAVRDYLTREGATLAARGEEHYYFIRNRFNSEHDPLDFLFLNRAGFNGMIRFNRKGGFNIPFCRKPDRFAKAYVTKIVNQVAAVAALLQSRRMVFAVQDFEQTIAAARAGDIVYCDPPYIGRHVDYFNGWSDADERRLSDALAKSPAQFILSTWSGNRHRTNDLIRDVWSEANVLRREHFYHLGANLENRGSVTEALIHSDGLAPTIPLAGAGVAPGS